MVLKPQSFLAVADLEGLGEAFVVIIVNIINMLSNA